MRDGKQRNEDGTAADGGTESAPASADTVTGTERTETGVPNETIAGIEPEERRAFLLETLRRMPLLRSLQSEAADASTLSNAVDMSRSTVHRALNSLEDHDIVEKLSDEYELTTLGEVITAEAQAFGTRACTTVTLKQFLNSIEMNGETFPVEYFEDAEITQRTSRQPHKTIHRILELIRNADTLRMFSTVISPVYVDVGYREMMDGMPIEAIFDRPVVDLMLSEYPEKAHETISTGNFDVYAHDGLPFELFLFDDEIGMAAHNHNGNAEVLVECDDAAAIEWAEDIYSRHLSNAEPIAMSNQ